MGTGWGRITNDLDTFTEDFTNNKAGSQALREVKVPIKSTEFCENVPEFGFNDLKFDKRFCAGGVEGNEYYLATTLEKVVLILIHMHK